MLLKRLEMQGFKSFADKTVFDFTKGTTAIVGPNGSGKSNISDAIRWVIGETSAKSLRGSNMQDVIFAGTQARKQLNFAEVSLVLDNSTHIFDIEFEEVIVTRRLFRSGESIYQINKANCRLKDIHELFMDTGLGRDGYSIIGQGNVSQILSTKAEDRRSIFEEAAGVSKYKYRKEEAIRKLNGVEENLVRINDITLELENQLEPLARQSEKARKYLDLYGEFKALDVNMSLITLEKNKKNAEENEKLFESVNGELSELRSKESETEQKITALYDESKAKDAEKSEQNNRLLENRSEAMNAKNEINIAKNNIKNNTDSEKRLEEEIQTLTEQNKIRENNIEEIKNKISETELQAKKIIENMDAMRAENENIGAGGDELMEKIDKKKNELIDKLNGFASLKEKINGIEVLRKSFLERREAVETELKNFNEDRENIEEQSKKCSEAISEATAKLEKVSGTVSKLREREETLQKELSDNERELGSANVEYNSKASKKKILEGMENDYAGYAKSVKAVLKAESLKKLAIYGTLSGLIDVKREYVTAIEIALGGALQNIITESEEDAKAAIAYLKQTKQGRATFLPITSVKGRELENAKELSKENGYIGVASLLVSCDKKYDGIIKSLLGRVIVMDNIDNAVILSRKYGYRFKIVTVGGELLSPGGSMSGGSVNKQSGFLSRATEIKNLTKEISELYTRISELTERKKTAQNDISLVKSQLDSYLPMAREYKEDIIRSESTREHLSNLLKTSGQTEENYRTELSQIEQQLSSSSEEIAVALAQSRSLENESNALKEEITEMTERHEQIISDKEQKAQNIVEETMRLADMQKEADMMRASIENIRSEMKNTLTLIEMKEQDKERISHENDTLDKLIDEKNDKLTAMEKLSDEIEQKISEIDEQKTKIVDTLKEIQNSNKDLTDTLLNLQQELSRVEAKKMRLDMERENTINRLWDEYELSVSDAEQIRTEVENEKEAAKTLVSLKNKLRALGSVNVDSIEEYKNVKERYEFLSTQKADLEKSELNLNKIIDSMEELMEEHFTERFTEINKSFTTVFEELFGGGKGELWLSDPDNVLESGIEIKAQLPGKGLQNINLYSGGEKSFIAIALLFAILRVNPTPFCILDEIDAALDDVNVSRFATYLKNYIDQTQFIIITHRRGTMEAANILYGITMQEKGVSKLLSLHIDDVSDEMVS